MEDNDTAMDQVKKELPEVLKMLHSLPHSINDTNKFFKSLIKKVNSDNFNISKGIGFLTMKCNTLLSYIIDLALVMMEKSEGNSLEKNYAVERLVENRTVWEKILPIDHKLKYQIDKVVQAAVTGQDGSDPLKFRARPDNLVPKLDEDEDDDDENEKSKRYVPPKLAAAQCGNLTVKERQEKLLERAKKRALGSSMLQDLKREYDEAPEEYGESRSLHRIKENKEEEERIRYEEEHFVRLPVTKKEKVSSRRLATTSSLGQLAHFENISALYDDQDLDLGAPNKKKKKMQGKKGKGKKKGFKKKKKW